MLVIASFQVLSCKKVPESVQNTEAVKTNEWRFD